MTDESNKTGNDGKAEKAVEPVVAEDIETEEEDIEDDTPELDIKLGNELWDRLSADRRDTWKLERRRWEIIRAAIDTETEVSEGELKFMREMLLKLKMMCYEDDKGKKPVCPFVAKPAELPWTAAGDLPAEAATEEEGHEHVGAVTEPQMDLWRGGAVREIAGNRPRPDLISPLFELRLGQHLAKGAVKYSPRNWERGIPNSRHWESLNRHRVQYAIGDTSEDHLAAMAANLMFLMHNEDAIKAGILPKELDDLGHYTKEKDNE